MQKSEIQKAGEFLIRLIDGKSPIDSEMALIFLTGNSGCGKDTQTELLISWWKETQPDPSVVAIIMGDQFRQHKEEFPQSAFVAKMNRISLTERQPSLMPLIVSAEKLFEIKNKPGELCIINGSPRSVEELGLWANLISHGCLPKAHLIEIAVPEDECIRRLMERRRSDSDTEEKARKKTSWYSDVQMMIEAMKGYNFVQSFVKLHQVDGLGTIQEIHERITNLLKEKF